MIDLHILDHVISAGNEVVGCLNKNKSLQGYGNITIKIQFLFEGLIMKCIVHQVASKNRSLRCGYEKFRNSPEQKVQQSGLDTITVHSNLECTTNSVAGAVSMVDYMQVTDLRLAMPQAQAAAQREEGA